MLEWLRNRQSGTGDEEMPITEHLSELRDRILYSVVAIAVCASLGFYYAREIIALMMYPLQQAMSGFPIQAQLHFTSITEPLFQSFKIALFVGIGLAFPFWVWQLWKFIAPGLYHNEKRLVTPFISSASVLFLLGVAFAYFIAVPLAYRFLLLYANPYNELAQQRAGQPSIRLDFVPVRPKPIPKRLKPLPKTSSSQSLPLRLQMQAIQPRTKAKTPSQKQPTSRPLKRKPTMNQGFSLQLSAGLPPTQMTPQALLMELSRRKSVEFQVVRGKAIQTYRINYSWPKPKTNRAGGLLKPILTLQAYLSVSSWFLLGFGLIFQTPLVILLLTSSGIVTTQFLRTYRRHAFVAILVVAAVLTPTGDPLNLMIMAVPMYILYEIGIFMSDLLKLNFLPPLEEPPAPDDDTTPPSEGV